MSRVLIIEDNRDLAENIVELFRDAGIDAVSTDSAEDALRLASELDPELVIVDVRLPNSTSGIDLLPLLRDAATDIEAILVTGSAALDTAIEAVRQGVFAYVLKPFDPDGLLALGERALSQVQLRRERSSLAKELARSEAMYRSVVESVTALIVGIDGDGNVAVANSFSAELCQRDLAELRGIAFADIFVSDGDRAAINQAIAACMSGVTMPERELSMLAGSGERRVIRWTLAPLREVGETAARILAVGLDVTDRIELERRTAQNEALAVMGQLTTGLAHEIRNPLNAAKLQLELLLRRTAKTDGEMADRVTRRVTIVQHELSRLSSLLDDFLSLARPRGIQSVPFELLRVIEAVVRLHAPIAAQHAITIEISPGACGGSVAVGEEARVQQVLVNLIGNAIEAMRERGGRIVLSIAERDNLLEVSVADTGPGLAEDVLDDLFTPFVTTKEAGTGLGLTIAKQIVEMHGGTIHLGPAQPQGTMARFTIPAAPRENDPDSDGGGT